GRGGDPDWTRHLFKTFCPKCIGMGGRKLPATTLGRCILVELRRRKISEPIERFAHRDDAELAQLRSRLARWAGDSEEALSAAKTPMPERFDNRRADNWRAMLAIADLAGEDWGDKARLAASKIALFGCAPRRPLDYSASAGLLWAMNGGRLVELHRDWAVIDMPLQTRQRVFYRRNV